MAFSAVAQTNTLPTGTINNVPVATFTYSQESHVPVFSGTVYWGDTTSAPATIFRDPTIPGQWDVTADADYAAAGDYFLRVHLIDSANSKSDWVSTREPVAASGANTPTVTVTPSMSFPTGTAIGNVQVATFTDTNYTGATASDFAATIEWGDGSSSTGTVSGPVSGVFTVTASKTAPYYTTVGNESLRVLVSAVGVANSSTWTSSVGTLTTGRDDFGATTAADGTLYAVGGYDGTNVLSSVNESLPPAAFSAGPNLPAATLNLAVTTGADGSIYAIGGQAGSVTSTVDMLSGGTWSAIASLPTARESLTAVTGLDGKIYAIGGYTGSSYSGEVDVYDPVAGTWTTLSSTMPDPRENAAAVVDPNGKIFVIGGYDGSASTSVDEFDPSTGVWTALASLSTASQGITAVLGADGNIYAMGGYNGSTRSSSVEDYNIAGGSWSSFASSLPNAITLGAATIGVNGDIYSMGGYNGTTRLSEVDSLATFAAPTSAQSTTVVVTKGTPTISWNDPSDIGYGTLLGSGQLDATVPVIGGTWIYSPAAGTRMNVGQDQTLTARFIPYDTTDYNTPSPVTVEINVDKANATLTWSTPTSITYGTDLSSTQLDAASNIPGTFGYTPSSGTELSAGSHTLHVTFTPTDGLDYNVTTATVTQVVNQATPTITWTNPSDITYGTALSVLELDASASTPGSFVYNHTEGTVLDAGLDQTLSVTFTPTDTTDYSSNTASVSLNVLQAIPILNWIQPADISFGTALSGTQLDATAVGSLPGTFTYTPAAGTVLPGGSQFLSVEFTATDTTDYSDATDSVLINVGKATPQVDWSNPASITFGTDLSSTQLDAIASVPGTFVYTPAIGYEMHAGTGQTLSVIFTPTDLADYTQVTQTATITVNQATPVLTYPYPSNIYYGTALGLAQLDATSTVAGTFSYSPPSGTILSAGNTQSIVATFTPTDTTDYVSGGTATALINVLKVTPTLTWVNPADITYGTALSATQLDATSSVAGTFSYNESLGTVLSAGASQVLTTTFTPTDTTDYNDNTASVTITVNKATPTINWSNPADIPYLTPLSSTQLDATATSPVTMATVPGTFVYNPALGYVFNAGQNWNLGVTFTPTDTADFNAATDTVYLNVTKLTPTVTWATPSPITYGTELSGTQLDATASVAGGFSYTPASGTTPTAGTHTLSTTFTPTDTTDYTTVTQTTSLVVNKATPTVSWTPPTGITYGAPLTGTQLAATASVAGTFIYSPPSGTILPAGSGETLSVAFTPTDTLDYNTVPATTTTINVAKATPTTNWATPSSIVYGTPLGGVQLNASSPVPGSFTYTPATGTVLTVGVGQALSAMFNPTDTADYNTASASTTITVTKANVPITWTTPAGITYGTPLSLTQYSATTSVAGTFAYSHVIGTVLNAGPNQPLSEVFTPTDLVDYNITTATVYINVAKAVPTITWTTPSPITYGTPLSGTQLDATASVGGTFVYTPLSGHVMNAGANQTLSALFTPTDTVDYTTASGTTTITVNKATPVVSWSSPAGITYGTPLNGTQLDASSATAGSFAYTPASGAIVHVGPSQILTAVFTPTDTVDYNSVTQTTTIAVSKATPTVTWNTPAAIAYGTPLGATQLDATTPVAGTFTYNPLAGVVLQAGMYTLQTTFTPTDTADYNPATGAAFLTVNKAMPMINWATPAPIVYGTPLSATQLNATTTVAGTFAYVPVVGAVPHAGQQTLAATFTPTDTVDYLVANPSVTLSVHKATPVYQWSVRSSIVYGTPLSGSQLDASTNVAGTFVYTPGPGTVLHAGNGQTLSAVFTPTDSQDYNTITPVAGINVTKAPLTIAAYSLVKAYDTANPPLNLQYTGFVNGDGPANLSTQATVTTPVTTVTQPQIYPITVTGGTSSDYTITDVNGTFTVVQPSAVVQGDMALVDTLYIDLLNRSADDAGLASYVNQLIAGVTPQTVLNEFTSSAEYQNLQKTGHGTGITPNNALTAALNAQTYATTHPKGPYQF